MKGINSIKRAMIYFFINNILAGTEMFELKNWLLKKTGVEIGENTKIVGPLYCSASLVIGRDCWIGRNFEINGNGNVMIGNNCDIAPSVSIQTGGHEVGSGQRRAGKNIKYSVYINDGCWIGARSTILGGVRIENGCIVAAASCVCHDVAKNTLVGGVPAKVIKELENEQSEFIN